MVYINQWLHCLLLIATKKAIRRQSRGIVLCLPEDWPTFAFPLRRRCPTLINTTVTLKQHPAWYIYFQLVIGLLFSDSIEMYFTYITTTLKPYKISYKILFKLLAAVFSKFFGPRFSIYKFRHQYMICVFTFTRRLFMNKNIHFSLIGYKSTLKSLCNV